MLDNDVILSTFEQAAEVHGDITEMVYKDFLAKNPEAEKYFYIRGDEFVSNLKERMVQDAIYSLLEYLDNPEEVDITFKYIVPQHQDLDIPTQYFAALLESISEVVYSSVDANKLAATKQHWTLLIDAFRDIVERNTR